MKHTLPDFTKKVVVLSFPTTDDSRSFVAERGGTRRLYKRYEMGQRPRHDRQEKTDEMKETLTWGGNRPNPASALFCWSRCKAASDVTINSPKTYVEMR